MKKPKKLWQVMVRMKMEEQGLTCKDVAERIGRSHESVRQAMSKDVSPSVRNEICNLFGVMNDDSATN